MLLLQRKPDNAAFYKTSDQMFTTGLILNNIFYIKIHMQDTVTSLKND